MAINNTYPIVDISHINQDNIESQGTKDKFWYIEQNETYLFKSIQVTKEGVSHLRIGEDCSEKIACEIAKLLHIPHAHYELADYKGLRGVISKNFISKNKGEFLVSGKELLEKLYLDSNNEQVHQRITRVFIIMEHLIKRKPMDFNSLENIKSAGEYFTGYLMLDALISNQDRHNENWGLIQRVDGKRHLAISFDHGASLGKNLKDSEKKERLLTSDKGRSVANFTSRAKSWFYLNNEKTSRLKVLEAFNTFGKFYPCAYEAWIHRLSEINDNAIEEIIWNIPSELMSEISKKFAFEMIKCNKQAIIASLVIPDSLNTPNSE
ncbi:hypothetical protein RFH42_03025 [Acinetobacter rudis]|uniref:hypothetical protein n=1 Tax=Acinetobacter rudis TaxID=632955 RepID=UPI00280D149B|nr:hypothetical protein [Acinetobacter rudis]MDQ8951926.1 hypothetical protein [Acinetobacter rudis]